MVVVRRADPSIATSTCELVVTPADSSGTSGGSGASARRDIQGLRAVAVLLVIAYHAGLPLPAGFAGVDVFFVISGFVITGQIRRMNEAGTWSFAEFYARRIRRLTPALVVVVLAVLLGSLLVQSPLGLQDTTAKTAAGALLAAGNVAVFVATGNYFDAGAEGNPLLHTWSLGVEEQFYLVFPLVIIWCGRARRPVAAVVLAALTAASLAASVGLTFAGTTLAGHPSSQLAFYGSPTRAWEFGAGALLALGSSGRPGRPSRPTLLAVTGVVLFLTMNLVIDRTTPWPGILAMLPVVATVLLLAAGSSGSNPVSDLLGRRLLVRIGDLSYSLYLWHWPAIVFATLLWPGRPWVPAAAAVAGVAPAWVSHRYVEQPLRSHRGPPARVFAVGAVTVAAGLALALAMPRAGMALVPSAAELAADRHTPTFGRSTGCMVDGRAYRRSDIARCTVRVPQPKGWVMLAGDSHADALSVGFLAAARQLHYDAVALTGSGCAATANATSNSVPNCGELSRDVLDLATGSDDPPTAVVLAHWSTARMTYDPNWRRSYEATIRRLSTAGIRVIVALDVPNFARFDTVDGTPCPGGLVNFSCEQPERAVLAYEGAARAMEGQLAAAAGADVLDPWPVFCRRGTCDPRVHGRLGYYDYNHLNRIGSAALTPLFVAGLTAT